MRRIFVHCLVFPMAIYVHTARGDLTTWMIDMSSNNHDVKIETDMKVGRDVIRGIIHRASIGEYKPPEQQGDRDFKRRAKEAYDAKLHFGAYHVAFPRTGAKSQADQFIEAIKCQCVPGQRLMLAIDWEYLCTKPRPGAKQCDPIRKARDQWAIVPPSFVVELANRVEDLTGRRPIIYTNKSVLHEFKEFILGTTVGDQLKRNMLWLAQYATQKHGLTLPPRSDYEPWEHWTFLQYGSNKDTPPPTPTMSTTIQNLPIDGSFYDGQRSEIDEFVYANSWQCDRAQPNRHD